MKKNELKLLASRAVNKIGNVVYDYGNSSWIVSLGPMVQRYLGYYQLAENLISLFLNPIGGAVADRFKRRKIFAGNWFCGWPHVPASSLDWDRPHHALWPHQCQCYPGHFPCLFRDLFRSYVVSLVEKDRLVGFQCQAGSHLPNYQHFLSFLAYLFVDRFVSNRPCSWIAWPSFSPLPFSFHPSSRKTCRRTQGSASVGAILRDIRKCSLFIFHE